jgi:hypothetical protein
MLSGLVTRWNSGLSTSEASPLDGGAPEIAYTSRTPCNAPLRKRPTPSGALALLCRHIDKIPPYGSPEFEIWLATLDTNRGAARCSSRSSCMEVCCSTR